MKHFLLILILLLSGAIEAYGSNSCYRSHINDPLAEIERINKDNNRYLSNDAPVEYQIFILKERQKKKALRLLERVKKGDVASDKDLSIIAEDLVAILYGQQDLVDRYFLKSKDERKQESIRLQARTQLIEKGLKSFISKQPVHQKISLWIKVKKNVRRIFQSQVVNWAQVPFNLPEFKNKRISEELLGKIIWNGISPHQREIDAYYKVQSKKEIYSSFRRIYSFVIIGVLATQGYQQGLAKDKAENKAKVEFVTEQLEYVADNLPKEVQEYKEQIREEALKNAIVEFEAELNRAPTSAEIAEMQTIIFESN